MKKKIIAKSSDDVQEEGGFKISANTQIVFTVKSFLLTIGTILGIFYGFYQLVVVPKINLTENNYRQMFEDQKSQNTLFYQELGKINTSIGSLSSSIDAINREKLTIKTLNNTSGALGDDADEKNNNNTAYIIKNK